MNVVTVCSLVGTTGKTGTAVIIGLHAVGCTGNAIIVQSNGTVSLVQTDEKRLQDDLQVWQQMMGVSATGTLTLKVRRR